MNTNDTKIVTKRGETNPCDVLHKNRLVSNLNFTLYAVIFFCATLAMLLALRHVFSTIFFYMFCMMCVCARLITIFIYSKLVRKTIETVSVCFYARKFITSLVKCGTIRFIYIIEDTVYF